MSTARIDALESRRLLSVGLDNGVLNILGTAHGDVVDVRSDLKDFSKIDVKLNHKTWQFDRAHIHSLFIRTFRGTDQVSVAWFLPTGYPGIDMHLPSHIYTDADRDIVWIQGGSAHVFAGDGVDQVDAAVDPERCTIYGEGGNDYLRGGTGNDLLVGGDGNDQLRGR